MGFLRGVHAQAGPQGLAETPMQGHCFSTSAKLRVGAPDAAAEDLHQRFGVKGCKIALALRRMAFRDTLRTDYISKMQSVTVSTLYAFILLYLIFSSKSIAKSQ